MASDAVLGDMDGGAWTGIERWIQWLETTISTLLGEFALTHAKLQEPESASEGAFGATDTGDSADLGVVASPTMASGDEATQAEVEQAVREVESDSGTDRKQDVVEPPLR